MEVVQVQQFGDAIVCPYNKSHIIPAARIQWHLSRCRRQYPNAKIAVCRFNASHHIPEADLQLHEKRCPDRVLVEIFKHPLDGGDHSATKMVEPQAEYNVQADDTGLGAVANATQQKADHAADDENWDDMDAPRYDPQAYCRKNPIIRKVTHMTPSEKKKFYAEEQVRINTILKQREEEEKKRKQSQK